MKPAAPSSLTRYTPLRDARAIVQGLVALLVWEWSGLDLPLAHLYGNAAGFPWRNQWLLVGLMHEGALIVAWAFMGLLIWSIWHPGPLAQVLSRRDRLWWVATSFACVAIVMLLKRASWTSCPWSLVEFGGYRAHYVSHWVMGLRDGGPGGCFPSGHAATAFAMLGGWFVLRRKAPG